MNTFITTICSNLWRNEMKNGSYQHHIIWKKEVWPKLPLVVTSRHSMPPVVTCCHSLYHLLSFGVTRCHLLYHSLSFVVIRCHSLYHSLSLVVIRCHSLYHSLSFVVTRCTTHCHSLSLDVPLVWLFINSPYGRWKMELLYEIM